MRVTTTVRRELVVVTAPLAPVVVPTSVSTFVNVRTGGGAGGVGLAAGGGLLPPAGVFAFVAAGGGCWAGAGFCVFAGGGAWVLAG